MNNKRLEAEKEVERRGDIIMSVLNGIAIYVLVPILIACACMTSGIAFLLVLGYEDASTIICFLYGLPAMFAMASAFYAIKAWENKPLKDLDNE
ncbi:hypothetical protein N9137_00880 [Pseudomonadales bacterium]|nr:hypothetical protein [Pseudomonadales bacterium]